MLEHILKRSFVLLALSMAGAAMAQSSSYLTTGGTLRVGQYLISPNHRAIAIQQGDGNFCVYETGSPSAATSQNYAWCHMSHGATGQYFTIIQTDGNLCTYRGTGVGDNHGGTWCSMRYGPEGPHFVVLTNEGNLCTHKGNSPTDDWGLLWCTMDNAVVTATPGVIDVSQALGGLFNADPNGWRSVAQAIGAASPELWYIESMKVSKLDNTGFAPSAIQAQAVYVGSQQAVNCSATTAYNQAVTVSNDVTNSLSISKSTTFDASVSATVSYSGLVWSGSMTATASTSTTSGSENSTSNTATVSKTATVDIPANSGVIVALSAARKVGTNSPWTASFVPSDDQNVQIVARRIGRNDRQSGTLPWIQVKSYLPQDKRTLTLTGTLTVDSTDITTAATTLYTLSPDQVSQVCAASAPPILVGSKSAKAVAGGPISGLQANAVAPAGQAKVVTKKLSAAETSAMLRNLPPAGH